MSNAPELARILGLIRNGQLTAADGALQRYLNAFPTDPDALQLTGTVLRKLGRLDDAIAFFKRSLDQREMQPTVHNNLGNALLAAGNVTTAERHYKRALELDRRNVDARYNLGLLKIGQSEFEAACSHLEQVTREQPNYANAWIALSNACSQLQRFDRAREAADRAVALAPNAHVAWHALAQRRADVNDYAGAADAFQRAVALKPDSDQSWVGLGNAHRFRGDDGSAAFAYRRALACNPGNVIAHQSLNEVLWQSADPSYLQSYPAAIATRPSDGTLRLNYAQQLLKIGQHAAARRELSAAQTLLPGNPDVADALAVSAQASGELEEAIVHHRAAIAADPWNRDCRRHFAETLLKAGRYRETLDVTAQGLAFDPFDQGVLAMHTVALRLLGDARYRALANYEELPGVFDLEPPPGYADVGAFNRALAEELHKHHAAKNHPTDQTVRGGSQTFGALFAHDIPVVVALKSQIAKAVQSFIEAMPADSAHPFLGRKSSAFKFSGSWSVWLKPQGFHTNHVHPKGWISSVYYVGLPPGAESNPQHEGWLKMGETNLALGENERIERIFQPRAGRLVLFPSYFWHGTIPFQSGDRLTVAFDAVPV